VTTTNLAGWTPAQYAYAYLWWVSEKDGQPYEPTVSGALELQARRYEQHVDNVDPPTQVYVNADWTTNMFHSAFRELEKMMVFK